MSSYTVCVVSRHPIVVAGIRTLLTEIHDSTQFTLVTDPDDAEVIIYDVFNLAVDVQHGDELRRLVAAHPGRVLALSRLLQPALTTRALAAGAVAPVSLGADAIELAALIEASATGALATDAELAQQSLEQLNKQLRVDVRLTAREESVLALIAAGYSNDQIAAELCISVNTVKSTIRKTYPRLRVHSRAQAVAWAIEHGYATPTPRPR